MNRYLTIHIPETSAPAPVSHFLRTQAGLTKKQISQAKFRPGGVQKNGQQCRVTETAYPGDQITVCLETNNVDSAQLESATFVKYTAILEKYIKPDLGEYFSEAVSAMLVEQFSYHLLHEKNLSPKTVRDILSVLNSILDYAVKQNPLARPVEIVYPRTEQKEMRVLTVEEQKRFTEYLLQDMDACKFGVLLALMTGLRIGELCALKWEDISLEEKFIYVRHTMQRLKDLNPVSEEKTRIVTGGPKSGKSARVIPMNEDIWNLCARWKTDDPGAYILTGKKERFLEPRTLQYRMKLYTDACNLEGVHFHTLRHSFATRCVEAGFEIRSLSEILGHSSTRITLECYVHSSMRLKRANMEKLKMKTGKTEKNSRL